MSMLHRVEDYDNYGDVGGSIRLSFDTEYYGYWMCEWMKSGMRELPSQKSFHFLKGAEQKRIKALGPVIYLFTFGELPKDLQAQVS